MRAGKNRQPVSTAKVEVSPPSETPNEAYFRIYGKPPHHRMKPETILEKIKDGNTSGCSS